MFSLSNHQEFYYYLESTDMRKGFNGLSGLVTDHFRASNSKDIVYIFMNKRKDKMKLLHYSLSGFMLYYKRLETGVFILPDYEIKKGLLHLTYTKLILLVDGIQITNLKKRTDFTMNK